MLVRQRILRGVYYSRRLCLRGPRTGRMAERSEARRRRRRVTTTKPPLPVGGGWAEAALRLCIWYEEKRRRIARAAALKKPSILFERGCGGRRKAKRR